jgi:hypothetical protein
MKSLGIVIVASVALVACETAPSDHLLRTGFATDPESLASGPGNTFDHMQQSTGGENGVTDPNVKHVEDSQVGSPEVVARMHATQKITYAELGAMLADFGVNLQSTTVGSAGALYKAGASALGNAIYASRVPEQIVPSTSSLAKQFDIFTAASSEIVAKIGGSTRCPGVVLVTNNQLTEDGISCLIGKPARPEHVTLANQLVTEATTPQIGIQIAIATLLSAAHTSE